MVCYAVYKTYMLHATFQFHAALIFTKKDFTKKKKEYFTSFFLDATDDGIGVLCSDGSLFNDWGGVGR